MHVNIVFTFKGGAHPIAICQKTNSIVGFKNECGTKSCCDHDIKELTLTHSHADIFLGLIKVWNTD